MAANDSNSDKWKYDIGDEVTSGGNPGLHLVVKERHTREGAYGKETTYLVEVVGAPDDDWKTIPKAELEQYYYKSSRADRHDADEQRRRSGEDKDGMPDIFR